MDGDVLIDGETAATNVSGCLSVLIRLSFCVLAVVVVFAALLACGVSKSRGKLLAVEEHLRTTSAAIPKAVRSTLADYEAGDRLNPEDLPTPLRAPGLIFARIGEEHITLVVTVNPDTDAGYRLWLGQQAEDYEDQQTGMPGVYRYSYCDDYESSPTNQPW